MTLVTRALLVAFATLTVGLSGCSLTSDHFSCAFKTNGEAANCIDYTNVAIQYRTTIETLCRGVSGDFSTNSCPTANRVGGCSGKSSDGDGVSWFYTSTKYMTLADAAKECTPDQTLVDPQGKPVDRGSGVCTKPGSGVLVLTIINRTAGPVTAYIRNPQCVEVKQTVVPAGGIEGRPTTTNEVWVLRAGDGNPAGTILREVVVTQSDSVILE